MRVSHAVIRINHKRNYLFFPLALSTVISCNNLQSKHYLLFTFSNKLLSVWSRGGSSQ